MKEKNSDEKLVEQYTSRDPGLIARYLGTKRYKMKSMHKGFPSYKKALFFKAVSEVVKDYEERVSFDISPYGDIVSTTNEYLEVGRNKNEELMTSGYRLLMNDSNLPLAVKVEQDPWTGTNFLTVSYSNKHSSEALEFFKAVEDYMRDNNFYQGEKINVDGKFLTLNNIDFSEVVLPQQDTKSIKMGALDFFKKKDIYVKNNIPYKRGLIFTGIPGTGKTLTGKILMNNCESTFLWVTADNLAKDKYTPAATITKRLFDMARELAPCILFMEDIDDFLEKEGAVDAIKTQMDGMDNLDGIVTIICTNFPEKLPMALVDRPSRFDDVILFKLPDEDLRFKILNKVGEPMDIDNKEELLKDLANKTEGLTGSHLKEIMIYALLTAVDDDREKVNADDLATALIKVRDTKKRVTQGLSLIDEKSLADELKLMLKSKKENK